MRNPHPLALAQVGVGSHRQLGLEHPLNGVDFTLGHRAESIPALSQDAYQASCLRDINKTDFIHDMVQKEVAGKHRHRNAMSDARTAGPYVQFGEKDGKSSGS